MNIQCSIKDCECPKLKDTDKCIIHHNFKELKNDNYAKYFLEIFKIFIMNEFAKQKQDALLSQEEVVSKSINKIVAEVLKPNAQINEKNFVVKIEGITFPDGLNANYFSSILQCYGQVHFEGCNFYFGFKHSDFINVSFNNCVFHKTHEILGVSHESNNNSSIYEKCIFKQNLNINNYIKINSLLSLFSDCKCENLYQIVSATVENDILNGIKFTQLFIYHSICKFDLILKDHDLSYLHIISSTIDGSFEVKGNIAGSVNIQKSTFYKNVCLADKECYFLNYISESTFHSSVDLSDTKFRSLTLKDCHFKDLVNFHNCTFTGENSGHVLINGIANKETNKKELSEGTSFSNIIFEGAVNITGAKFLRGLSLSNITFLHYPDFSTTIINHSNTSRETYRIIKHSYDSIGNTIEGNRAFEGEMYCYLNELYMLVCKGKDINNSQEKVSWGVRRHAFPKLVIVYFNFVFSAFGQSWLRPMCWLFFVSCVHWLSYNSYQVNYIVKNPKPNIFSIFNDIAYNILNFLPFLHDKFELSTIDNSGFALPAIIFYLLYAVLIYQLVISLKRIVRR